MNIAIMSDGASHRNGGMCGIGVHIINADTKEVLQQISEPIGEGTNTFAEYTAFTRGVQAAIQIAKSEKVENVMLLADSNLVVQQVQNLWKVKGNEIRHYVTAARTQIDELKRNVKKVIIDHIPREYNTEADWLSTQATEKAVEDTTEKKYPFLSK